MAEQIAAADIEILLDLRVWGGGNISEALALCPAPLQVNWLAYPGTSGAAWIDYVIADRQVLPAQLRGSFSEQVAWLPRCFQPSDPTRLIGDPPSRRECGLPEDGTVYACFNNSYKLDPRSVHRLFHVLRAVPDSVLWLLSGPGSSDNNLRGIATAAAIDPQRLVFMPKQPHLDYVARYRHVDLFLDTAIYNAHTTASDALWGGCPVLTTPGEAFASRVAASLNHHLGLPELNVEDDDHFVAFATRIGMDRLERDALHARLAGLRTSGDLFDMRGFATDFMHLMRQMAARHRDGLPPAALDG
jgi:predicted O-linked N-acetylglucosamine transferase (SPINDLY family)